MDETKLKALIADATAHCYDAEDEFWGIFSALISHVTFPVQARASGEEVTLVSLDGPTSSPEAGVMVRVQTSGGEQVIPLVQVEPVASADTSGQWLEAYRYWRNKAGG